LGQRAIVCVGSGRHPFVLALPCGIRLHVRAFRLLARCLVSTAA
jgi:hypothetical protein